MMDHPLNRSRGKWYATALVAGQLLLLAYQVQRPNSRGVSTLRDSSVQAILPVERLTQAGVSGVGGFFRHFAGYGQTERQNTALQAQVSQLELQNQQLRESVRELPQLQALLGFQRGYGVRTLAAQVVGRGLSADAQVVYINRGADQGLRRNMPVITPGGVAGKISQVLAASAQVLLVTDPDSGVGALIVAPPPPAPAPAPAASSATPPPAVATPNAAAPAPQPQPQPTTPASGEAAGGVHGILQGMGAGRAVLRQVLKDEPTPNGALVITSGEDQVYPKGIPIGTVTGSQPSTDGVFKTVNVKLAADLDRLEQVLVITGAVPAPPDEANAGQTAADIRQARLPALPTPATGKDTPAVPKVTPLPTDTPPAEGDDLGQGR